jgi:hypothetical protein
MGKAQQTEKRLLRYSPKDLNEASQKIEFLVWYMDQSVAANDVLLKTLVGQLKEDIRALERRMGGEGKPVASKKREAGGKGRRVR